MKSLTDIANEYGTDKGTLGPSENWGGHNYTDLYDAYLWPLRDQPVHLLEIGLGVTGDAWDARIVVGRNSGGGASIKMWYDYFPRGQLVGLDINPGAHLDNDRISTFIVDQGDSEALRSVCRGREFDVVVDDGSHRPDHQQISLGTIWPHLKAGGFYIIEDLTNNGRGDPDRGRHHSTSVLNTRSVIRSFAESGRIRRPSPHR